MMKTDKELVIEIDDSENTFFMKIYTSFASLFFALLALTTDYPQLIDLLWMGSIVSGLAFLGLLFASYFERHHTPYFVEPGSDRTGKYIGLVRRDKYAREVKENSDEPTILMPCVRWYATADKRSYVQAITDHQFSNLIPVKRI